MALYCLVQIRIRRSEYVITRTFAFAKRSFPRFHVFCPEPFPLSDHVAKGIPSTSRIFLLNKWIIRYSLCLYVNQRNFSIQPLKPWYFRVSYESTNDVTISYNILQNYASIKFELDIINSNSRPDFQPKFSGTRAPLVIVLCIINFVKVTGGKFKLVYEMIFWIITIMTYRTAHVQFNYAV